MFLILQPRSQHLNVLITPEDSTASYNWRSSPSRKKHYGPGNEVVIVLFWKKIQMKTKQLVQDFD